VESADDAADDAFESEMPLLPRLLPPMPLNRGEAASASWSAERGTEPRVNDDAEDEEEDGDADATPEEEVEEEDDDETELRFAAPLARAAADGCPLPLPMPLLFP
jgi:hypothetical protein